MLLTLAGVSMAHKHKIPDRLGGRDPRLDGGSSLLRQLESDGLTGLVLNDGGTADDLTTVS